MLFFNATTLLAEFFATSSGFHASKLIPIVNKELFSKLALTGILVAFPVHQLFAEAVPRITAAKSNDTQIAVKLSAQTRSRPGKSYVVLARAIGDSEKYQNIAKIKLEKRISVKILDPVTAGETVVHYKTRISGRVQSRWSDSVLVKFARTITPTNPPPTDTPTIAPTSAPDVDSPISDPVAPAGITACDSSLTNLALVLVNQARSSDGAAPLDARSTLVASSKSFSFHMAETSILSHDGWFENLQKFGFTGSAMGQNIGYMSSQSAKGMVDAWLNSEGHRRNILSRSFKYTGIGCAVDSQGLVWWTEDFGG